RLAELARRLPVLMTGGNHDRWGDPFWDRELGIVYGAGELRFPLGNGTALALHGDQVPGRSRGYRLKDALIQSRLASTVYRLLPAELGFRITAGLARPSHSKGATRREEETARRQQAWAEAQLREAPDISVLIMSHSHRPAALELLPGRRYLNPGAWFEGFRYAVATDSALELSRYRG
ncbi:MAG TPA: hypothetical protein VJK71_06770, partial [Gemmatimonadales bacterium]|nr:hypothetical protein [Gemmatimonadales bacterium]